MSLVSFDDCANDLSKFFDVKDDSVSINKIIFKLYNNMISDPKSNIEPTDTINSSLNHLWDLESKFNKRFTDILSTLDKTINKISYTSSVIAKVAPVLPQPKKKEECIITTTCKEDNDYKAESSDIFFIRTEDTKNFPMYELIIRGRHNNKKENIECFVLNAQHENRNMDIEDNEIEIKRDKKTSVKLNFRTPKEAPGYYFSVIKLVDKDTMRQIGENFNINIIVNDEDE